MSAISKLEGHIWIGQNPTTLDNLAGKVVLVHFWTFSSVNCRRTLPYIQGWEEKYTEEDFVVIGIHTPEFEFEQNPKNIENAIRELGVTWPVLLDREGDIVYSRLGEGGYKETEAKIRELLGLQGEGFAGAIDEHIHGESCVTPTPEMYCGYLRGSIANDLSYAEEVEDAYQAPDVLREGEIALDGAFFSSPEYAESREEGATLSVSFHATRVDVVLGSDKDGANAEILLDDFPLEDDVRGEDVDTESHVAVKRSGAYNLIQSRKAIDGVLKIRARQGNFRAYVFTFSGD